MPWITPDFEEINLAMEVTAYANTDVSQQLSPSVPAVDPPVVSEPTASEAVAASPV